MTAKQNPSYLRNLLKNPQEYTKDGDEQMDSDDIQIIGEINDEERKKRNDLANAENKKEAGNALYNQCKYWDALKMYSEALDLCPDVAAYYGNRCACYMMLGKYQSAINDASKSIMIDDKFIKGYIRKLKCHIALGEVENAELTIEKLKELNETNNADYLKEKDNIDKIKKLISDCERLYKKEEFKSLLYYVKNLLKISPHSMKFRLMKCECLIELKEYKEAHDLVSELLLIDNKNADGLYLRGLSLYYQDSVDKALAHFQQTIRLSPEHCKAKSAYKKVKLLMSKKEEGNSAFTNNKLAEAYDIYTFALGIDPKNTIMNAKLYFNRAVVSAKRRKFNDALEDCNNAIKLDPHYTKAILKRARLYMDLEMFEEAVREYQRLYQQDKKHELKQLLHEAQIALKKSKRKDYYKILGVTKTASEDEIKKAYRKRAMLHHPDRHSNASEDEKKEQEKKFKELGEAYSILTDPKKKSRYDNGLDLDDSGPSSYSEYDANLFNLFTGGSAGGFHSGSFPGFSFQSGGFSNHSNQNPFHFFQ